MARLRKSLLVLVFVMKYWWRTGPANPNPSISLLISFLQRACHTLVCKPSIGKVESIHSSSTMSCYRRGVGISTLDSHLKQPICLEFASGRVGTTQARPGALCDERYRPDHRAEKRPAVSPRHPVTGCEGMASIPAASSIRRKTAEKSFSLLPDNSSEFT